ncbi:MAG: hypothetical protein GY732_21260 [Gammaproteobacteria bacterium]|nr:hypothetical protein [Gammaproteobacteria bacterium]
MKYILLSVFVFFAAQPFQASYCDMQVSQEASHGGHNMQHGSKADTDGAGMDCCDHDPSTPSDSCDSMSHCGACVIAASAINPSAIIVFYHVDSHLYSPETNEHLSDFSSPPFRPPIS